MPNLDVKSVLTELEEQELLPNPVDVRDMMLRTHLEPDRLVEMNRLFKEYLKFYGSSQEIARSILKMLASSPAKK